MNRRDFLQLFTFGMLSQLAPNFMWKPGMNPRAGSSPNILVVVFDAWSAANVSLYGYPRETTPNINKLAEKAIVYHNHYSGGSFTSPGTASLLTGRYPWTHQVVKEFQMLTQTDIHKNIFSLLRDDFFQAAYTHNPLADTLIKQQSSNITEYVSREKLYLTKDIVFDRWLTKDYQFANLARQLAFYQQLQRFQPSILFQWIYQLAIYQDVEEIEKKYPRGIPTMGDSAQRFSLEESIDWIINNASDWQAPFFGYFHLLPPHEPYNTRQEFIDVFRDDGFIPEEKPMHPFSIQYAAERRLLDRQQYDEFILLVDEEFARLYNLPEQRGALENTWIILTSDHGESFERGMYHHETRLLFNPVIHTPLLIFPPGLENRIDVTQTTSSVDLVPTILQLANMEIPDWVEGIPLPLTATEDIPTRPVFSMNFVENRPKLPYTVGTIAMFFKGYKIMKLIGYPELEGNTLVEVYHLDSDPEEMDNLVLKNDPVVAELEIMLDAYLAEANEKFS